MTLGELIRTLKKVDPNHNVPSGFHRPHSYRGYYEQLAFEPKENCSVKEMLEAAESAVGNTFTGWKGGDYTMDENTDCWISEVGSTGDAMSQLLFDYMLAGAKKVEDIKVKPVEHRFLEVRMKEAKVMLGPKEYFERLHLLEEFSKMYRQAALEAVSEMGIDIVDADGANRDTFLHFLDLHLTPQFRGM
jgi:hypothetical protein